MADPAANAAGRPHPLATLQDHLSRAVGKGWFWALFVGTLFTLPLLDALRREVPDAPPVYFQIPEFRLTDHFNEPFGSKELTGKLWVANFIFTSCPTRCPALTETMAKLQKRLKNMGDAVMLVSFSVDPERDTPEKLQEYAKKYHANPRRWRFLTGELAPVEQAIVQGFKMPMEPGEAVPGKPELFDITHGTRLVLVDRQGHVRGFYETDPESLDQLMADLSLLANLGDTGQRRASAQ